MSLQFLDQQAATKMDVELMSPEMGFTVDILMELAGLSSAQAIQNAYPVADFPKVILMIGPGNNGGDGLVCARHLFHFGYKVHVVYPKQREVHPFVGLKKQCTWLNLPFSTSLEGIKLEDFNLIVDSIFGYSFKSGDIRPPFLEIIQALKSTKVPIASIDIPSGWDVEKGDADGNGIQPDFLISLTAPKVGSTKFTGRYHYLGGRFVPPEMAEKYGISKLPPYSGGDQFVLLSHPFLYKWTGPYGGVMPFDKVKPTHLPLALRQGLDEALHNIQLVAENSAAPTWENTIEAFENAGHNLDRVTTIYHIYGLLLSDDYIQGIENEWEPKLAEFADKIYQNGALFKRIKALYDARETSGFTEEQKRLLWVRHQEFISRGALVADADKPRLTAINGELATLFTKFGHNLLADENQFVELKEDELAGLPEDVIDGARAAAKEAGREGYYHIVNTRSAVEPFLTSSTRRDLREIVWKKFVSRGDNGDANDNNQIVADILKLRAERAKLLGYKTHAHWRTDDTMAKTPENASKLMDDVWKPATQRVKEEVTEMQKIADKEGHGITIEPWDYRFYAEKVRVAQYDLDMDLVKPYLRLEQMKEAIFWVANQLFHITFTKIDVPVYHSDVEAYEVKDKNGEHVGLWYFDPFARKGKRSGAWMNEYRCQEKYKGKQTPIVSNNANFMKPSNKDDPVLLSWDDAVTLFHEFGHGLHGLLSNVNYGGLAGTRVFTDYVEFPSQLLENWLCVPEVLLKFATNVKGEPIPLQLVEKIQKTMKFNKGFDTVEYLASALVDMKLHLAASADQCIDVKSFEANTLKEIGMPPQIVMRHRTTQFSHLWDSDGYAACYWSYLWADSIVADAWEGFTVDGAGPFDAALAAKLYQFVFSAGNTIEPSEGYKKFRGREPNIEALMRKRGFL